MTESGNTKGRPEPPLGLESPKVSVSVGGRPRYLTASQGRPRDFRGALPLFGSPGIFTESNFPWTSAMITSKPRARNSAAQLAPTTPCTNDGDSSYRLV